MTVRAFVEGMNPARIDLDGKIDPKTGVRYLGRAWRNNATGRWLCLADVGALCVVEVRLVIDGGAENPLDPDAPSALRLVSGEEVSPSIPEGAPPP